MRLTVLISTHNRATLLEKTLTSLNRARRPSDFHTDVLVVANACTDETPVFLETYLAQAADKNWLPLAWLVEPQPGKSHALNRAIPELQSNLVALVDDDHRVDENYLTAICSAAESYPDATLFCGRILPDWDGSEPAWVHDTGRYRIYPPPVPVQDQGDAPHPVGLEGPTPGGGNLILRRAVFDRVGDFATELGPQGHNLGGGEDTDFILRTLNAGEQLVYIPDIKQYHFVDPERLRLGYLLRKSFQRSRAAVKMRHNRDGVPLYMWRKLGKYLFHATVSLNRAKSRCFLVRTAAMLGEIQGIRESWRTS
jgi:GT2 family glycosyltransferase